MKVILESHIQGGQPMVRRQKKCASSYCGDDVAIVHNGIIENYAELSKELRAQGCLFQSDTDSEVIAVLISKELAKKDL